MKPQLVIFDYDGLMVDSEEFSFISYHDYLTRFGIDMTREAYFGTYLGMSLKDTLEKFEEDYNISFDVQEAMEICVQVEIECLTTIGAPMRKGLLELLDYLEENGYRKCIATSSVLNRCMVTLKRHHIEDRFDSMTVATDVKKAKPNPDIFLVACKKEGVDPGEALVLEDSESGVEAAVAAGIPVICIPGLKQPDERHRKMATKVMDSLLDVIDYLEEMK